MRNLQVVAVALLCAALPGAALAEPKEVFTVADPKLVAEVARGYGSVVIEKDSDSDPLVKGKSEGIAYSIYFYGCKANANCRSIQMRSAFNHKGVKLEKINEWNLKKRFARANLDSEGDPVVRMDFDFDGGVTRDSLDNALNIWTRQLKGYTEHIGFKR